MTDIKTVGPSLTDEQVQEGRAAIQLLCSFFGEGMHNNICELNIKVGDLIQAVDGRTEEQIQARFVCR